MLIEHVNMPVDKKLVEEFVKVVLFDRLRYPQECEPMHLGRSVAIETELKTLNEYIEEKTDLLYRAFNNEVTAEDSYAYKRVREYASGVKQFRRLYSEYIQRLDEIGSEVETDYDTKRERIIVYRHGDGRDTEWRSRDEKIDIDQPSADADTGGDENKKGQRSRSRSRPESEKFVKCVKYVRDPDLKHLADIGKYDYMIELVDDDDEENYTDKKNFVSEFRGESAYRQRSILEDQYSIAASSVFRDVIYSNIGFINDDVDREDRYFDLVLKIVNSGYE